MYPQFFGFHKLPFRLRLDVDFLYSGREYLQARADVLAALRGNSRAVLLVGPPGVGKTMLLEDVLDEIEREFALCRINQPHISATELLQALLLQLGAPSAEANAGLSQLIAELTATNDTGDQDAAPLLVVDDAHLLAGATLRTFEEILARVPRLKILFAARSGCRRVAEDLAGRATPAEETREVRLHALSAEEAKAYVERRLAVAGGGDKELFAADAHAMIFQHTGGTVRLINVLCDAALHAACMRASGHVSAAEVHLATQDSRWPEAVARNTASPGAPRDDAPAAPAHLYVRHGAEQIGAWPVKAGRISIGRATDNELRLEARFISRHHCHVVTVGHVSTIEDLGSVNGVCVNGRSVKRHILQHEDQITLGEHVLTYLVG